MDNHQFLIALPFCFKDQKYTKQMLDFILKMDGAGAYRNVDCLLCWDGVSEHDLKDITDKAKQMFGKVMVTQCPYNEHGWPQGPNAMWRTINKFIAHYCNMPFLLMEPDMIPCKPDWLNTVIDEYRKCGALFLGSMVQIPDHPGHLHMNGAGVYPANLWMHLDDSTINARDNGAWDAVGGKKVLESRSYRDSKLFQHHWYEDGKQQPMSFNTIEDLDFLKPDVVLFHRNKDGSLIERLSEKMFGAIKPAPRSRSRVVTIVPETQFDAQTKTTKPVGKPAGKPVRSRSKKSGARAGVRGTPQNSLGS